MVPRNSKCDLHCHSSASEVAGLGVQRALGLPECATPPLEVYELAKRRGMDFVTITDHNTIDGCLELDHLPDVFISEELTAYFKGEPQAVHILVWGIDQSDHEWLQAHSGDLESCAAYISQHEITAGLAHPFYDVAAPLTPRHRRRLADLFPIWEVRNGARMSELNSPALIYAETNGATGVAGSDDHGGVDIGRTWTEVPYAASPQEFLKRIREGDADPRGEEGSVAKWAHAALAIAARSLPPGPETSAAGPDPAAAYRFATQLVAQGAARTGQGTPPLGAGEAASLLLTWLEALGFAGDPRDLITHMQADDFSHDTLRRSARHAHEVALREVAESVTFSVADLTRSTATAFQAVIPALPYIPAGAVLAGEKRRLVDVRRRGQNPVRVAITADGIGVNHGVARTIEQIRRYGVEGFNIEVLGTDPRVDRRLPAVSEIGVPLYEGARMPVPAITDMAEAISAGSFDLIHVTSPGPVGVGALLLAGMSATPAVISHHSDFLSLLRFRGGGEQLERIAGTALAAYNAAADLVLSPSPAADADLAKAGVDSNRILRWERGVDLERFSPQHADGESFPGDIKLLYVGRLSREKGIERLADTVLRARAREPRLHLLVAGTGPEGELLPARLGRHVTMLGPLGGERLARAYASADIFLFCSTTDTFGQAVNEAAASGLPVVVTDRGGPASLVEHEHSGLVCRPDPDRLADAVLELAASERLRRRFGAAGRAAAGRRTWSRSLGQLAIAYRRALEGRRPASLNGASTRGCARAVAEVGGSYSTVRVPSMPASR